MHFFSPSVNVCLPSGNGMTCTSECPLIYYFVAILWKIFGYHEFIYRLVELVIAYSGLYALFLLTKELVQDRFWALFVSLLLFSSPLFAFYANNFIMDVPSLSLALIAWYFFMRYDKTKQLFLFNLSILFFLLAGLTKISALLSFVPLIVIFLWELFKKNKNQKERLFISPIKQSIPIIILIIIITAWTNYAIRYNNIHNAGLFSTRILPIWDLSLTDIYTILTILYNNSLPQFFSFSIIFFSLVLFLAILINFKKIKPFYYWLNIMIFGGCILYILLWFQALHDNEYYMINLLVFIPASVLTFLVFLKENYAFLLASRKLKIIFAVILGFNVYYCSVQINLRYPYNTLPIKNSFIVEEQTKNLWNYYNWYYEANIKALETITPYLRSLYISRNDKVISIPDPTPDVSLYLMDQKGYPNDGSYKNSNKIKKIKNLGAKYLILSNPSFIDSAWLKPYLKNKIGSYKNVTIYDLRNLN